MLILQMSPKPLKQNTQLRHQVIYTRFKELVASVSKEGRYNHIYLTSLYVQIAEETGYSESHVAHVVARMNRVQPNS